MLNQAPAATRKILLVDDHPIVRLGCISLLRQINPTSEFYEADDQEQALQLARRLAPCVALVDLSLAGNLTLDLIKQLRVHTPQMAILVVSMHDEKHYAERALRADAQGYVMKQIAASSIIQAVQTVLDGRVWLSDSLRMELDTRLTADAAPVRDAGLAALSNRELTVFQLIGRGMKKSEIARALAVSPQPLKRIGPISSKSWVYPAALNCIASLFCIRKGRRIS